MYPSMYPKMYPSSVERMCSAEPRPIREKLPTDVAFFCGRSTVELFRRRFPALTRGPPTKVGHTGV